jgi:hypothetical protein
VVELPPDWPVVPGELVLPVCAGAPGRDPVPVPVPAPKLVPVPIPAPVELPADCDADCDDIEADCCMEPTRI